MPRDIAIEGPALLDAIASLPGWRLQGGVLVKDLKFPSFIAAIAFVNKAAALAEAADHHPDLDIRYNKVRVALVTHDSAGITQRDLALARQLDEAFAAG